MYSSDSKCFFFIIDKIGLEDVLLINVLLVIEEFFEIGEDIVILFVIIVVSIL